MKLRRIGLLFAVMATVAASHGAAAPPNVLIILADDLGYSDLGCYGSEIRTPNLDRLAENGLRFTQFYNAARCWPTRAALLTGFYAQQVRRDELEGVPSGSRGVRPDWARLLPEMLKQNKFRSYHSGKWHIDGEPLAAGFDHSYNLADQGRFFSPKRHFSDGNQLTEIDRDAGYYATTAIADHAIECLQEHAAKYADQPFFHFLAFTAPHFPLHALPEDIDRYRETYRVGWNDIRQRRWRRMREMGVAKGALSEVETNIGPPYDFPDAIETLGPGEVNRPVNWESLTEEQKGFQATKMAIHAAMIDRMDQEIGRVLDQINRMGALEKTLILFLSDNGASAEIMVRDDGHDPNAEPGSAATHLCLGPGWSTTSNTPFRRHKTWVHEGGISTPLIVHWPNGFSARGELRRNVGHVIDIAPTVLDVVGAAPLSKWNDTPIPIPPGKSLAPAFAMDGSVEHEYFWWSHEGNRAIRVGDWKLVASGKDGEWELFDLANDRNETTNLAPDNSGRVRDMAKLWRDRRDAFRALAVRDLGAR